jgi:hypothetical protein
MRFRAADVQRAFEAVGFPSFDRTDKRFVQTVEKAVRFLTTPKQRETLSRRLLQTLPDYVEAGRHLDGWIIQHSAYLTADMPEGVTGPFLLAMFLHGMREWEKQRDREQEALLTEMGLSTEEIRRLGYDRIEARLRELMANPDKSAAMKKFLAQHPELEAMSQAQCREAEEAAVALLEREDAHVLLLSPDEVGPWLAVLDRRILEAPEGYAAFPTNRPPDKKTTEALAKLVYDAAAEMATAIFTPTRLDRLRSRIHEYRRGFSPENDRRVMAGIHGALAATQSGGDPANSHFLVTLCWVSIRTAMLSLK